MSLKQGHVPELTCIEDSKFYEIFGNNTRLELLSNAFAINKLIIRFQKFSDAKKELGRITAYLDIDKALVMANDILFSRLNKKINPNNPNIQKVFTQSGGSVKENKITYREISISKGKKWIIGCMECKGKKTDTGGFMPETGCPEKQEINVGMDEETLRGIALIIIQECQAYRTAQWSNISIPTSNLDANKTQLQPNNKLIITNKDIKLSKSYISNNTVIISLNWQENQIN